MRMKLKTPNGGAVIEVDRDQAIDLMARGFTRLDTDPVPAAPAASEAPVPEPANASEADEAEPEAPADEADAADESPTLRPYRRTRKTSEA